MTTNWKLNNQKLTIKLTTQKLTKYLTIVSLENPLRARIGGEGGGFPSRKLPTVAKAVLVLIQTLFFWKRAERIRSKQQRLSLPEPNRTFLDT
jgi:hypothetical protein